MDVNFNSIPESMRWACEHLFDGGKVDEYLFHVIETDLEPRCHAYVVRSLELIIDEKGIEPSSAEKVDLLVSRIRDEHFAFLNREGLEGARRELVPYVYDSLIPLSVFSKGKGEFLEAFVKHYVSGKETEDSLRPFTRSENKSLGEVLREVYSSRFHTELCDDDVLRAIKKVIPFTQSKRRESLKEQFIGLEICRG